MKAFIYYVVAVALLCVAPGHAQAQGRSANHSFFGGIVDRVEKGARGFGRTIQRVPDRFGFHGQTGRAQAATRHRHEPRQQRNHRPRPPPTFSVTRRLH
jgi:hypothetical protein